MVRFLTYLGGAVLPRLFYPLASWPVRGRVSAENFACNRAHDISRVPVRSQRAPEVMHMRYARTSCSKTGCGAIAVYNALTVLGLAVSLAEILYQMEHRRFAACGGRFGTNPFALGRVLALYPVRARRFRRMETLAGVMETGDAAILVIWNDRHRLSRGAHFFAVQRTTEGFTAHNRAGTAESGILAEILGPGRFITAYLVQTLA